MSMFGSSSGRRPQSDFLEIDRYHGMEKGPNMKGTKGGVRLMLMLLKMPCLL